MNQMLAANRSVAATRYVTLTVTIPILITVATGIAHAANCAGLPRPHMRVRVTVTSKHIPEAAPVIRNIVDQSWQRHGVTFDWADDSDRSSSKEPFDAWIAAVHGMPIRFDGGDMGQVLFHHEVPAQLIRISIDAVIMWVLGQQKTRLQTSTQFPPQMAMLVGDTAPLVVRALGHVAAHELGHFMLGRAHAASGLMAGSWDWNFTRTAQLLTQESLPLDSISKATLRSRLQASASCLEIAKHR
jgi:hypothetical protein